MRLPQSLRRVPRHKHDAETHDRSEQSEHKAIVCMLGNRIHVRSSLRQTQRSRLEPNARLATEPSHRYCGFIHLHS